MSLHAAFAPLVVPQAATRKRARSGTGPIEPPVLATCAIIVLTAGAVPAALSALIVWVRPSVSYGPAVSTTLPMCALSILRPASHGRPAGGGAALATKLPFCGRFDGSGGCNAVGSGNPASWWRVFLDTDSNGQCGTGGPFGHAWVPWGSGTAAPFTWMDDGSVAMWQ